MQQKKPMSWFWKGMLLAGMGIVAAKVAMKYSKPLAAGTARLSRWASDKVLHTGKGLKEKWQDVTLEAETAVSTGDSEDNHHITSQARDMVNKAKDRMENISDTVTELAGEMIPRLRVSPIAYRRYKRRNMPGRD